MHLEIQAAAFRAAVHANGQALIVALPADLAAALLRGLGKAGAGPLDSAPDA